MQCPNCLSYNESDAVYCAKCGTNLAEATKEVRKSGVLAILASINAFGFLPLAGMFFILLLIFGGLGENPEEITRTLFFTGVYIVASVIFFLYATHRVIKKSREGSIVYWSILAAIILSIIYTIVKILFNG